MTKLITDIGTPRSLRSLARVRSSQRCSKCGVRHEGTPIIDRGRLVVPNCETNDE